MNTTGIPTRHNATVGAMAARVRQFAATHTPFRVYHGSSNSTRRSDRHEDNIIDTSKLDQVLRVDPVRKTALVEPNVSMDKLIDITAHYGLVPRVVMGVPGITVGGGFSGTSWESSSFKWGPFDATVNWIEIILPDGTVQMASKTEKPDLFWGAASAFGTMGIVTLLEVQLMNAKRYVELTYRREGDFGQVVETLLDQTALGTSNDYVDAIVFAKDSTLICTGQLTDALPRGAVPQRFLRARDPWFYIHAERIEKQLRRSPPNTKLRDYVPLVDYLFRYDRGSFWTARYVFQYFLTPLNRYTRFVLDPLVRTRVASRTLHHSGLHDTHIVQDVGIPVPRAEEFVEWVDANLHIYPLWLCPVFVRRLERNSQYGLHADFGAPDGPDMYLNFGIWGPASSSQGDALRKNRALEQEVARLGGKKWLYSHVYYREDEFWEQYDRRAYDRVRRRYGADYLPSVYEKVRLDSEAEDAATRVTWIAWLFAIIWTIWPLRGLLALIRAVLGRDNLLQQRHNGLRRLIGSE